MSFRIESQFNYKIDIGIGEIFETKMTEANS